MNTCRKLLSALLCLALLVSLLPLGAVPVRAAGENTLAGNGTPDNPYQIATADDLRAFAAIVNGTDNQTAQPDAWAVLTADINLNNQAWTPIGTDDSTGFAGTFDGGDHTISGLYINNGYYQGFFGVVGSSGTVTNLTIEGAVTTSTATCFGSVAGKNNGTIRDCKNQVSVTINTITEEDLYVGGMVGINYGVIESCTNTNTIVVKPDTKYNSYVGGVVGENYSGTVKGCTNSGEVTGKGSSVSVGGAVGVNDDTITGCTNSGDVIGKGSYAKVGGVVGDNDETTTDCTNSGDVTGEDPDAMTGGVVGDNTGTVCGCYTIGIVSGGTAGGVIGLSRFGTVSDCYWLDTASNLGVDDKGSTDVKNVESKTIDQFKSGEVAWLLQDALGGTDSTATQVWGQAIDTDDYPVLTSDSDKKVYQVTFKDGGSTFAIDYANSGDTVTKPTDPTKTGYNLVGWYSDENLSQEWDFDKSTVAEDINLYAKWTLNQYTITFDTDGGSDVDSLSVDYGDTVTKPADPTRDGYTFDGWYSDKDFKTAWDFNTQISDNITLYAKWTEIPTYTVTVAASSHGSVTANPTSAAAGETVTLTIAPETGYTLADLNVADANGTAITVNDSENTYTFTMPDSAVTVTATFRLIDIPVDPDPTPIPDPDPSGPSTGESDGWESIADEITAADDGDSITIDMNGETEVPADIFEDVAGKDVDLVFDMGDGLSWSVNGQDIPTDVDFSDLDLGVDLGTDGIPVDVINAITGELGSVQLTLAYDGEFGFILTLTAPLGEDNAGYWANLYHYDEDAEAMNFEAAAEIGADGSVSLPLSHASQYAIVIDDHNHAATDVSEIFTDVPANHWAKAAIQYAYDNGLMIGVSATEFAPEATTTRAMIVSMLARLENVTDADSAGFTDVADGDWYATSVNWAANEGIVAGFGDTFQPNAAITREQLAAMLMNYADYKGIDVSARADLSGYSDQPSAWAGEAVQWAVSEGLIAGVTDDELQPQGNATRAQVAAMLQRFIENVL